MNILVIGSINIDQVHYIKTFPLKGETITADEYAVFHGGKGANQAIAMKRILDNDNINVLMFAKVGDDEEGEKEIKNLQKNKIDVKYVSKSRMNTGKATILISYLDKDNKIIINKGANNDFDAKDKSALIKAIKNSNIILLQLEINEWLIDNSLKIAKKYNKTIILNPAPAEGFKCEWLKYIDWIIPNETELEFISNKKISNLKEMKEALMSLKKDGLKNAIVTLGDAGAYIFTPKITQWIEAEQVKVVDTTAAGDTFIGAFVACYLAKQSRDIKKQIKFAIKAASLTIQKKGAQISIPTAKEIKKWRKQN